MSKETEFDITVKTSGVNIHRKVDEKLGRRIVSILLGEDAASNGDNRPAASDRDTADTAERRGTLADSESFFGGLQGGKPADNALAVAAYHYSQYGSAEFTVDGMRELADAVGVTIPERLDMTYVQATRKGNRLFRRASRGAFRPTVHGEAFFKETYKVKKVPAESRRAMTIEVEDAFRP